MQSVHFMLHSYRTSVHTNLRSRTFEVYNQNKLSQLRQIVYSAKCNKPLVAAVGQGQVYRVGRQNLFLLAGLSCSFN